MEQDFVETGCISLQRHSEKKFYYDFLILFLINYFKTRHYYAHIIEKRRIRAILTTINVYLQENPQHSDLASPN